MPVADFLYFQVILCYNRGRGKMNMSSINPVPVNPPPVDLSQVPGQYAHAGQQGRKEGVLNPPTQQNVVQQQQLVQQSGYVFQNGQLQEIHQNITEETQPDKNREEKDKESESKERKHSPFTKLRKSRNPRLKV